MVYHTLAGPSEAKYTEKMSRFLAFAYPAGSAQEAREIVAKLQNEYHDARHVCWAYMIGAQRTEYQLNDNGEPSGTAGKPILGQINSFGLTNVVIAVVRYFGGIKLGTSGLIAAYRQAAKMAIEAGEIEELHERASILFTFTYAQMHEVMKIVKSAGIRILNQTLDNSCSMAIECNADDVEAISSMLASKGAKVG